MTIVHSESRYAAAPDAPGAVHTGSGEDDDAVRHAEAWEPETFAEGWSKITERQSVGSMS